MAGKTKQEAADLSSDPASAHFLEQTTAMNERLILSSVHQHELTEAAETLNEQLRVEMTERKQAEDALRASEERFRALVTASSDLVYRMNANWSEMRPVLGRDITAGMETPIREWLRKYVHPEDQPLVLAAIREAIQSKNIFELEHRVQRVDGTIGWTFSRAIPLFDAQGEIVEWFGTASDITARKETEEARRATMEELARASRAKDAFLAALSHELRTPLTPVLMMAAALEEDPTLAPEMRDHFGMVRRNIELEARLIDDLLDLTRISHGKLQIHPAITDLHQLLEQTAEIVSNDGFGKQVRIVFALEATRHHVMGDSARLQQVFWNIIKNALKFTPAGGRVTVSTRNDDAGMIIVSVSDTGIGIRAEALTQIFEAFEQGEITFQQRFGGLGLGLAISQALVKIHGGEIHAQSEGVGRGSTFSVTLASVEAPTLPEREQSRPQLQPRARRLLVVEDHEATLTVLERLLRRSGHDVISASSMSEGLAAAANGTFDAVISDLGLPDGTGFEMMEKLRATHGLRGIALSGYGMDEDLRRSKEAGFGAHLTKPVDFAQLERALEDLMATPAPSKS